MRCEQQDTNSAIFYHFIVMFSMYCFHSIYIYICFQGACDKDLQMVQCYGGNNMGFSYVLVPLLKI